MCTWYSFGGPYLPVHGHVRSCHSCPIFAEISHSREKRSARQKMRMFVPKKGCRPLREMTGPEVHYYMAVLGWRPTEARLSFRPLLMWSQW